GKLSEKIINDAKILSKCWTETMLLHQKDYWPQVAKDLNDLIMLILECEGNKEWKKKWDLIRSKSL
ncbi:hypothetical protein KKG15_01715, partial [Patescibacteria group bacterium]|nr:hypothetical protein [Patescibacteria group bacterium]